MMGPETGQEKKTDTQIQHLQTIFHEHGTLNNQQI